MPTFIDESGDTGRIERGGSAFFRLAAVWVPSQEDADRFRSNARRIRHDFGLRADYEFKFHKIHKHRNAGMSFLEASLALDLCFAVSSIDKTETAWRQADHAEILYAAVTDLSASLRETCRRAVDSRSNLFKEPNFVDNNADGDFLCLVKAQFRALKSDQPGHPPLVGKVSFKNSASDEMLQLADMICGAVGAIEDDIDRTWYQKIVARDLSPRPYCEQTTRGSPGNSQRAPLMSSSTKLSVTEPCPNQVDFKLLAASHRTWP
jgi:hypothetical protein